MKPEIGVEIDKKPWLVAKPFKGFMHFIEALRRIDNNNEVSSKE